MLDDDQPTTDSTESSGPAPEAPASDAPAAEAPADKPAKKAAAKKATAKKAPARKRATKKTAEAPAAESGETPSESSGEATEGAPPASTGVLFQPPETVVQPARKRAARKTTAKKAAAAEPTEAESPETGATDGGDGADAEAKPAKKTARKRATKKAAADTPADDKPTDEASDDKAADQASDDKTSQDSGDSGDGDGDGEGGGKRRARRRGGRRRRKGGGDGESDESNDSDSDESSDEAGDGDSDESGDGEGGSSSSRRRRRRRGRSGGGGDSDGGGGGGNGGGSGGGGGRTRNPEDEITALSGSTRLEAKRQRRREGREAGRRRAPIVSEAEFLARRESVDRVMVVRQREELTQIGVLEDKVLVEHYVARESQTSLIGNVYLGRVQNVLPSMEAAFIDIGKGRNAVLYAGEVNWTALGAKDGQPRKIESVLSSGQTVLVQVTKDPIGHKGARLTSQVSLPGRFLVYVPDGTTSGISRKLPDNERNRLKTLLKEIVPDTAGVIVRTAAEGASEDELTKDVERLTARWTDIEAKVKAGNAPQLLYGEPDLTLKVVRDLFTEDFSRLVVQGEDAWNLVDDYVGHVAPDLRERLERYRPEEHDDVDLFASYRLDEQIAKGLDRKVWLPSGGSLIIDRTEAMTVIDVNTGKFTGSGGNLEETVTKNNLEAAEEIVRQLRLRDIGGIVVVDFIDMVLESNRDLVLRRMVECLGRDRTRHQVAEVTSLGLVQMTRKRIGTGLLEAFSEECEHCKGRGLTVHDHPIEPSTKPDDGERRGGRRTRGGRGRTGTGTGNGGSGGNGNGGSNGGNGNGNGGSGPVHHAPSPAEFAAMAGHHASDENDDLTDVTDVADAGETPDEATAPEAAPGVTLDQSEAPEAVETPEPAAEPESVEEPAPAPAPVVVTTTRRRGSRRVAGPPAAESVAEPVETPAPVETPEPVESAEPAEPAEPAAEADQPIDGVLEGTEGTDDAEGVEGVEGEDGDPVLHVPVKRKGSRKR